MVTLRGKKNYPLAMTETFLRVWTKKYQMKNKRNNNKNKVDSAFKAFLVLSTMIKWQIASHPNSKERKNKQKKCGD